MAGTNLMPFVTDRLVGLISAGVCVGILLFLFGSSVHSLVGRILRSAVLSVLLAAVLHFGLGIPTPAVGVIGTAAFLLGAVIRRV